MKVILNKCYGGFGISDAGYRLYAQKKGIDLFPYVQHPNGYMRVDDVGDDYGLLSYFTADFGKWADDNDIDWGKHLYLGEDHREDPVLIEVVEELGSDADGRFAELRVVDIPDGMDYVIDDYDGIETLHERVREW